jgi:hypothetical protein
MRFFDVHHRPFLGLGANPRLGEPLGLCMMPVKRIGDRWEWDLLLLAAQGLIPNLPPKVALFNHTLWSLPADRQTDWQAELVPWWANRTEYVAVFHVYPQAGVMAELPSSLPPIGSMQACVYSETISIGNQPLSHQVATRFVVQPGEEDTYAGLYRATFQAKALLNDLGDDDRHVGHLPRALVPWRETEPADRRQLCVALGSCQYAPGIINQEPGHASWQRLASRLMRGEEGPRPTMLVLTGDQVYIDASAGLFDPTQRDDRYGKPYEAWLRNQHVSEVVRHLPVATMLDDHEIEDNWEPISPALDDACKRNEQSRESGLESFWNYQRPPNWKPKFPLWSSLQQPVINTWLSRRASATDLPMFFLDTRSDRQLRTTASGATAEIISAAQWGDLQSWLKADARDLPRIVVCPSLLLPRHRDAVRARLLNGTDAGEGAALRSDSWDGYSGTFQRILQLIADEQLCVVFLSGDEHLGLFATARVQQLDSKQEGRIYTVHSPGLNTPYRFANAYPRDFILQETFSFGQDAGYQCTVERTDLIEGAGFVIVTIGQGADGNWRLQCEFDADDARRTDAHRVDVPLITAPLITAPR